MDNLFLKSGASFSPCRQYRYALWRIWNILTPPAAFIGLNCSTADEIKNDPTVTRCIKYAHKWGYGGLVMLNAFAFRATDPRVMKAQDDPVGPENDAWLRHYTGEAGIIICAWGNHGLFKNRQDQVLKLLQDRKLYCLGTNSTGTPKHPLYLKADARPMIF